MKWIIGCSGFSYKSWQPLFYPPKLPSSQWFEYYCEHFNTVELNVTFYRFPRAKNFITWYNRSPADFSFSVKAPRVITHFKQMIRSAEMINDFYKACTDGLKEKLGPVLFQFPERFVYTQERLQRLVDNLDPGFINVVEFRHESWWNDDVYKQLKKARLVFCFMSHPDLPDEVAGKGNRVYYRFHGVPEPYRSVYSDAEMERICGTIAAIKGVKTAWCYFNNDIDTAAIKNAKWLQEYSRRG